MNPNHYLNLELGFRGVVPGMSQELTSGTDTRDAARAQALRTVPFWAEVEEDGSVLSITPVPPTRDEIASNLEAILNDLPVTPGTAHSYDRVEIVTGPTTERSENGNIQIVRERQVYLRSAVNGQWFMVPLKVYTTDLPNGVEFKEAMGG